MNKMLLVLIFISLSLTLISCSRGNPTGEFTPTPTVNPGATPTPTSQSTPTATPLPTATTTVTPTATPTVTPTPTPNTYSISGIVTENDTGNPLANITLQFTGGYGSVISGADGHWTKSGLTGTVIVTVANHDAYYFNPYNQTVTHAATNVDFTGVKFHFVFHSTRNGNENIYLRNGAVETQLTTFANYNGCPDLSNDGLSFVFHSSKDDHTFNKIFKMNMGETIATPLDTNSCGCANWSADKSKIVYHRKVGTYWEVFTMDADGSNKLQLTDNALDSTKNSMDPCWSPDGSKIVFESDRNSGNKIYVMDANGSNVQVLAQGEEPVWSPDGTKIAYSAVTSGTSEICVMNSNGTGQTRLTFNSDTDSLPCWSPDNTRILYHSSPNSNPDIYMVNVDGTNIVRLTTNSAWDMAPGW